MLLEEGALGYHMFAGTVPSSPAVENLQNPMFDETLWFRPEMFWCSPWENLGSPGGIRTSTVI